MLYCQCTYLVPVPGQRDRADHGVVGDAHRDVRGAHRLAVGGLGPATPVVATP